MPRNEYYATQDRNGTEDEITIYTPRGRRMLCVAFWDEEDIASSQQLKKDAIHIVNALNTYKGRRRAGKEIVAKELPA